MKSFIIPIKKNVIFSLLKIKKSVIMLYPDKIPLRYINLPGVSGIKQRYKEKADLAVSIDCASMNQLARVEEVFEESKRIVEIDHHIYRTRFGDVQLVDQNACSVGEIVFLLLQELKIPLDKRIAECLLTSTLVESSSFSRQGVQVSTFEICSQLLHTGVNFRQISERYYWRKRLSAIHLSGLCLTRVKTRARNKLVWTIIYKKDFERYKGKQEDVDSVPDDILMIEEAEVSLLFREIYNNMLRVSLRSKTDIDVGYLASIYGGGGHHNVAGCRIHNNRKTIERLLNQVCNLVYKRMRDAKK